MKKIIKEQTQPSQTVNALDKETKKKWLTKAVELGCFDGYEWDLNETPLEKNGDIVLVAKGSESGKDWTIKYNPTDEKQQKTNFQILGTIESVEVPQTIRKWACRQLQAEIAKAPQPTTTQKTDDQKKEDGTDEVQQQFKVSDLKNLVAQSKTNQLSTSECEYVINAFYDFMAKEPYENLGNMHNDVKKSVEMCVRNGVLKNVKRRKKEDLKNKIIKLRDVNQRDTRLGKYKINVPILEAKKLDDLIKISLIETKEYKENKIIKETLTKNRLITILENIDSFENFSKPKKVKVGFKFLKEISELQEYDLINEDLQSLFQSIYGNSLNNIVDSVSQPLLDSIFTKIGLDEEFKKRVMENIKSKGSDLISNMSSCESLTRFISQSISEEMSKKLSTENIIKSDILNTTLLNAINDEKFKEILNNNLESNVCELFNKFTENAKNLVVRMSAL